MRKAAVIVAVFICWSVLPVDAQCPGNHRVTNVTSTTFSLYWHVAQAFSTKFVPATSKPLYDFIGVGPCSTAKFGPNPPTQCDWGAAYVYSTINNYYTAHLIARFASAAANNAANGCIFVCPGGTCQVRGGDGLPVELMDFAVE